MYGGHITETTLGFIAIHQLLEPSVAVVQEHLRGCEDCRRRLAETEAGLEREL
jgi:hypothetical protein